MSPRYLLIALSVVVNAGLGAVWWKSHYRPPPPAPSAENPAKAPAAAPAPVPLERTWASFSEGGEDADFVARLRADGFPPRIVRLLVELRVAERFAGRLRALDKKNVEKPYWQSQPWGVEYSFENRAERRAIYTEMRDAMKALLGSDTDELSEYQRAYRLRSFGNLPSEKVSGIEAINRDYGELEAQIREASKGVPLREDREKLAYLEKEKRADLVRLLTPEELDEYDRRTSPAASVIRSQLRFFDATEDEYLALYRAQRAFDERYGRDNLSGEQADRRRDALPELNKQFEAALGAQRFAEYQLMTDGNYGGTHAVVTNLGLPADAARQLVTLQRDINRRAEAVRADKTIPREQQATQLAALAAEATEKLTASLGGDQQLEAYKRMAGQWLYRLSPPAKPPGSR